MLKIQNLSYAYKKIQALKDVSFSLQDGEIMSIIGANGAGKSTLMKCIAGVLKTDSGSVILDDFHLHRNRTKWFAVVSCLFRRDGGYFRDFRWKKI